MVGREAVINRRSQHITAIRGEVFKNAVIEQINGAILMNAEQRRKNSPLPGGGEGLGERGQPSRAGFREPDKFSELGERHVLTNLPIRGEQRFSRQGMELKAAAQSFDGFTLGAGVAAIPGLLKNLYESMYYK